MLLTRLPLPSIKRAPKGSLDLTAMSVKRAFARPRRPLRNPPSSLEGGALDLHVLGLPPAFALSQDQTLKLDLKLLNRLITTFDEVPPYSSNAIHIADDAISEEIMV